VLDNATNLESGLNITDTQSGFRAFSTSTISIFRFRQNGLAIESEMLSDASRAGLRIKEVEIGVRYDVNCSTEHPIRHGIGVLIKVLQDMDLRRPLYYFTAPGIVFAAVGMGMGLSFLRDFYHGGNFYLGPALLAILLTLAGFFMAFNGILFHFISRLIHELERDSKPEPFRSRHDLDANFRRHADQTSKIMPGIDEVPEREHPGANSVFAGVLAAAPHEKVGLIEAVPMES
jgi:hypothetical protein